MALSLVINVIVGYFLQQSLTTGSYVLEVDVVFQNNGSMQMLYDTGNDFNTTQLVVASVQKGDNTLHFPFQLVDGEQLKHIRLDFGSNPALTDVMISSISLSNGDKTLFQLEKKEVVKKVGFLRSISSTDQATGTFFLDAGKKPLDPYVVFDPLNELIFPKWQRILLLVFPWLILLFVPLLNWVNKTKEQGAYELFFIGMFLSVIPLKIAWVTFTTLLLAAFALFRYFKKRQFHFGPIQISFLLFFAVPLLFLGDGDASKLAIPLGFVLFALISAIIDFSDLKGQIKKIYITVFLMLMSIIIVSWGLLMGYGGYYYSIDISNYFTNIKSYTHTLLFWVYYPHTTFLSFFILIGGLFCLDLNTKRQLSRSVGLLYAFFTVCTLLILGSRFALVLGVVLPFLYSISVKNLSRWLLPLWAVIFAFVVRFIGVLDPQRSQLWRTTWTAITEKFWMGHGTGTSSRVLPEHVVINKDGVDTLMEVNHSHNQFLTYMLENGFLGALLFLVVFLFLCYHYIRQKNKSLLLVSFLTLLLMIIESPFRTTTALYVIGFLLSVFYGTKKTPL
tara:strand:- start:68 stop:1750 length:1683 start_codon:yes stop_codon:yes gene_type:complete